MTTDDALREMRLLQANNTWHGDRCGEWASAIEAELGALRDRLKNPRFTPEEREALEVAREAIVNQADGEESGDPKYEALLTTIDAMLDAEPGGGT